MGALHKQLFFTSLHRLKQSSDAARSEYSTLRQNFTSLGDLSLAQATTGALFALEVYAWFAVGEEFGRGKISSYWERRTRRIDRPGRRRAGRRPRCSPFV